MPQPAPKHDPRTTASTKSTMASTIETKIERSSLGTTDARTMRARTSTAAARALVARSIAPASTKKTGR